MKVATLARLLLLAFILIFISATAYLLLDSLGVWVRLPSALTRGVEVLTGLFLLFALVGHLALATGAIPQIDPGHRRRA
jgi:hypothetical protein